MNGNLLQAVVAGARRSAGLRERAAAGENVTRASRGAGGPDDQKFIAALRPKGIRIVAECKRRSPSRGVLRREYDPAAVARSYQSAGAAAISVLTEPTFFDGSLDHLRAVRAAVDLPVLCKDFLTTEYQVLEAQAAGADAVLLIVAALEDGLLPRLIARAHSSGLAVLVEVHDRDELQRALDAGAEMIGVNSRNLRTLDVSLAIFDELAALLPRGVVLAVAESGLTCGDDLRRLHALRYDAFLIGERFMTQPDPGGALAALLADAGGPGGRR